MAEEVVIVVPSNPLSKALQVPSVNQQFATFTLTQTQPGIGPSALPNAVLLDGVFNAGLGGMTAKNRVVLFPYCSGPPGAQFSMRLYGWKNSGTTTPDSRYSVWIPFLLCELGCINAELQGPQWSGPAASPYDVLDSERLCDTISLTQGQLGPSGFISSTGPGTNLTAYALVELLGAQMFQFDFAQQGSPLQGPPQQDNVSMNCLWAMA